MMFWPVFVVIAGLIAGWSTINKAVADNTEDVKAHEERLQALERNSDVVANEMKHMGDDISDVNTKLGQQQMLMWQILQTVKNGGGGHTAHSPKVGTPLRMQ